MSITNSCPPPPFPHLLLERDGALSSQRGFEMIGLIDTRFLSLCSDYHNCVDSVGVSSTLFC